MTGLTSPTHIALLLVVLLLVFGAKRLPELGHSLGHGMREFKDSLTGASPVEAPEPAAQLAAAVPPEPAANPASATHLTRAPASLDVRLPADAAGFASDDPSGAAAMVAAASPQPSPDQP